MPRRSDIMPSRVMRNQWMILAKTSLLFPANLAIVKGITIYGEFSQFGRIYRHITRFVKNSESGFLVLFGFE